MKLSAQNIADYLEDKGYCVHYGTLNTNAILSGCRWLYSDQFKHDILYVEPPSDWLPGRKNSITAVTYGNDILQVEASSPEELFSTINEAFRYFDSWERRLLECILYKKSLDDLICIADEVFQAPMIVDGIDGQSYGITRNYPPEIHKTWQKRLENDAESFAFVRRNAGRPFMKRLMQSPYPMFNASEVWPGNTMHSNLYYNGRRTGFIVAYEYHKKMRPGDLHYMYVFARIVEQHIAQNPEKYCCITYFEHFLFSVLFQDNSRWDKLQTVFFYNHWKYEDPYCIYCLLPRQQDHPEIWRERQNEVATSMQLGNTEAVCVTHDQMLIVLLNLRNPDTERMVCRNFSREFGVGRSLTFYDIRKMRSFYLQAEKAAMTSVEKGRSLVKAERQIAEYVCRTLRKNEFAMSFVPDELIRLKQYDQEYKTSLLPTLHTLVMCNLNSTDAAAFLKLHRNTLLQRAHHIQMIIGITPKKLVEEHGYCSILLSCNLLLSK